MLLFLLVTLSLIFVAGKVRAQGRPGAIAGTVTDPGGAALKGAQVSLQSPVVNIATDEQGRFILNNLAPGKYTVTVTYVGFSPFTADASVTSGQTANIDAKLQVQSQSQTVLVTGARVSAEAEAINVERTADNVIQVLPVEVIQSLPNANMADALGRLPSVTLERDEGEGKYVQVRGTEPRLTNTTVDGINLPSQEPGVRQIKFDGIPADIVDTVQVSKTLLANMDGDGIGGSVNLITKTATDTPTVTVEGLGGYTPIVNGRGETEEDATVGKRFGASRRFGLLVGGHYDWNGRGIDDIEPVPDVATLSNGSTVPWKDAMDIREYEYFRTRWGVAGSADYRIANGSNVYLRVLYSDFKNYGDRWAYSLTDNTPGIQLLNPGNVGCPTDDSGTTVPPCAGAPTFNTQLRNPDMAVGSILLGGNHVLSSTWYTWEASVSRSSYGNSPYSTAGFSSNLSSSSCQYAPGATKDLYLPQWNSECYAEGYNPDNLVLSGIDRDLGHAAQLNLGVAGSGAYRYHLGGRLATFEYGGKFRNEHKFADTYVLTLSPSGTTPLSTFPNRLINHSYYNGGKYKLGYNAKVEDVMAYANANASAFTASSTKGQDPSQFDLVERIPAGYVMNTIDFASRLRFIVGLRVEGTTDDVQNLAFGSYPCDTDPSGSCASITPNKFSGSYYTLLPSASLRFSIGPDSLLHLTYARGLSRPDPQDIAQPLSWTDSGNGANRYSVSFGNANLKAETGDDIDILFDHYLKPFGAISVGYFFKSLQDPIITKTFQLVNYQPPGGPLSNYLATQPVNAGSAWISGFEASYLQHYSALPGLLGGLGLSANYGYTASGTSGIPGRTDHPSLLRNSPNAFNISPTYDRGRFSVRVGMSYNQANIYGYQYQDGTPGGVKGPLSDIYFYSHFQADAQGSVGLGRGLSLIVSGLNLNNEVFGFYQGSSQYMIQREYYQPTIMGGLRWSPARHEQ
jgi:TonB-dependent receptor